MPGGHYTGRIQDNLDQMRTSAPGVFYGIFKKNGFFDVQDPDNGLTDAQRAQVPAENQAKFTQMASAIAEMLYWWTGNADSGSESVVINDIITKLDAATSMNTAALNGVSAHMATANSATPAVALIAATQIGTVIESSMAIESSSQGVSKFHPDVIPFTMPGVPKIPVDIAVGYSPGKFPPQYAFMLSQEQT
jgi:hypothetical protein